MLPSKLHTKAVAAAVAVCLTSSASALDIVDVWRAASQHDSGIQAARAANDAGRTRRQQADALWRPSVALEGGAGWGGAESTMRGAQFSLPGSFPQKGVTFNTSVASGTSTKVMLGVRQPLFSAERSAQQAQLQIAANAAETEWGDAQQMLMLQSAEHYFSVALVHQRLALLLRQQQAVDKALVEAKDRFKLGDRPVIDVHEAQARADALRAQRSGLETELELSRVMLKDFSGLSPEPTSFSLPVRFPSPSEVSELDVWLSKAASGNAMLKLADAHWQNAQQESAKTHGMLLPSVDLVAMAGRERLSGQGDFGDAGTTMNHQAIGVQLTVPLYTGGMQSARHAETLALAEKARADKDRVGLSVQQQVKTAWMNLKAGSSQVEALQSALQASRARLDATQVGREAGDRTMLDQLNAENDAAAAELALSQARVNLFLARLRLALLAGELDDRLLVIAQPVR